MKTKTQSKPADNGNITTAEARELLQAEQAERVNACRQELEALLDKHGCRLDVAVMLRTNSVTPHLQIVPVE